MVMVKGKIIGLEGWFRYQYL